MPSKHSRNKRIPQQPSEDFLRMLKDSRPRVRAQAAKKIGHSRDPKYVKDLVRLYITTENEVQENRHTIKSAIREALRWFGPLAFEQLSEDFYNHDIEIRRAATALLGVIRCEKSIKPLLNAVEDPDPEIRARAIRSIGLLGISDADIEAKIITAFKDPDPAVRRLALSVAGILEVRSAVPHLLTCISKKEPESSMAGLATLFCSQDEVEGEEREIHVAIKSLGEIGDRSAVPELCKWLTELTASIPKSCRPKLETLASALGRIGDAGATESLFSALKFVVSQMTESMRKREENEGDSDCCCGSNEDLDPEKFYQTIDCITSALTRLEPAASLILVRLIRQFFSEYNRETEGIQIQRSAYWIQTPYILSEVEEIGKNRGPSMINPLLPLLQDENADLRKTVCTILAGSASKNGHVFESLANLMITDPDPEVRAWTINCLQKINPVRTLEKIIGALDNNPPGPPDVLELEEVKSLGREAVDKLIRACKTDEPDTATIKEALSALCVFTETSNTLAAKRGVPHRVRGRIL